MVQVDLPGALAVGQIFAWLSRDYLRKETHLMTHRLMGPMVTYFSLLFVPAGLFLMICWPAWECMYWWEWVEQSSMEPPVSFFYIGFYMSMILIGTVSYLIGHKLILTGREKTVKGLILISVTATLLPFFLWPFTWYHVGTYAQYHAVPRQTMTMFDRPGFFCSWMIVMGYFSLATVVFGVWLKKKAKTLGQ